MTDQPDCLEGAHKSVTIPHQIEIETTWAARTVLEPIQNAERRATFEALKPLLRCAGPVKVDSRIAPCITKDTQTDKTIARLHWRGRPGNCPGVIG